MTSNNVAGLASSKTDIVGKVVCLNLDEKGIPTENNDLLLKRLEKNEENGKNEEIMASDNDDEEEADDEDDDRSENDKESSSSDSDTTSDNESEFSSLTGLSNLSGHQWKPIMKPSIWIQKQMNAGVNPREILSQILANGTVISQDLNDMTLWRILASMLFEPPKRRKLRHINTLEDFINLLKTCKNILVLTGAGVSVSCGIPDFRSSNGIYSRLAKDFPGLPDPQAMFDINYFYKDPRPFYKFAKEIYPGQFRPSTCHRFIKLLETKGRLLRNYTQNIDTLEQVAKVENVIECHGSFATATCTKCKFRTNSDAIRDDIFAQRIPMCLQCQKQRREAAKERDEIDIIDESQIPYEELVDYGIMKPDIVFFGEGLPDSFHSAITSDKGKCDLLIVIGSSLKVHPVALIPRSISPDIPQILINRERLNQFEFDVELLGDSDTIITHLCKSLGEDYAQLIDETKPILVESKELKPRFDEDTLKKNLSRPDDDTDSQSSKFGIIGNANGNSGTFYDSGFESTSFSSNIGSTNSLENSETGGYPANSRKHHHHHHHHHHFHHKTIKRRFDDNSPDYIQSMIASSDLSDNSRENNFIVHSDLIDFKHKVMENTPDVRHFSMETSSAQPATKAELFTVEDSQSTSTLNSYHQPNIPTASTTNSDRYPIKWMPKKRSIATCLSDRLPKDAYYRHIKNCVYVFPGAEVYLNSDIESSSSEDTEDNDDDDDNDESQNDIDENEPASDTDSIEKSDKTLPRFSLNEGHNGNRQSLTKKYSRSNSKTNDDINPPPTKKSCNLEID